MHRFGLKCTGNCGGRDPQVYPAEVTTTSGASNESANTVALALRSFLAALAAADEPFKNQSYYKNNDDFDKNVRCQTERIEVGCYWRVSRLIPILPKFYKHHRPSPPKYDRVLKADGRRRKFFVQNSLRDIQPAKSARYNYHCNRS